MSSVDVAAIRAAMAKATPGPWMADSVDEPWVIGQQSRGEMLREVAHVVHDQADAELIVLLRNNAQALLAEVERAQAASAGVDMLIAQAERRGAVKALRSVAAETADWVQAERPFDGSGLVESRADYIESGADL